MKTDVYILYTITVQYIMVYVYDTMQENKFYSTQSVSMNLHTSARSKISHNLLLSLISHNSRITIDHECSPYLDLNFIFTLPSKWATSDNQSCSNISYFYDKYL